MNNKALERAREWVNGNDEAKILTHLGANPSGIYHMLAAYEAHVLERRQVEVINLRKKIHLTERHNQWFERCESAWCNPSADNDPGKNQCVGDPWRPPRWASTMDEVPSQGQWCHVVIDGIVQIQPARLCGRMWVWFDESADNCPFEKVTHWQLLPEPPKEVA